MSEMYRATSDGSRWIAACRESIVSMVLPLPYEPDRSMSVQIAVACRSFPGRISTSVALKPSLDFRAGIGPFVWKLPGFSNPFAFESIARLFDSVPDESKKNPTMSLVIFATDRGRAMCQN